MGPEMTQIHGLGGSIPLRHPATFAQLHPLGPKWERSHLASLLSGLFPSLHIPSLRPQCLLRIEPVCPKPFKAGASPSCLSSQTQMSPVSSATLGNKSQPPRAATLLGFSLEGWPWLDSSKPGRVTNDRDCGLPLFPWQRLCST